LARPLPRSKPNQIYLPRTILPLTYFIHLPMKMEPMVSSETSAIRTQTPGNYPKRNKLHICRVLCSHALQYISIPSVAYISSYDLVGRYSSVGITTRYGLDGPGIESRWGQDFPHFSIPALGSTQPLI